MTNYFDLNMENNMRMRDTQFFGMFCLKTVEIRSNVNQMFLILFSPITCIITCCMLWQITWNNADIIFWPKTSLKVSSKPLQKLPYLVNLKNDISIICAKTSHKKI